MLSILENGGKDVFVQGNDVWGWFLAVLGSCAIPKRHSDTGMVFIILENCGVGGGGGTLDPEVISIFIEVVRRALQMLPNPRANPFLKRKEFMLNSTPQNVNYPIILRSQVFTNACGNLVNLKREVMTGRIRESRTDALEEDVLNLIDESPETSTRKIGSALNALLENHSSWTCTVVAINSSLQVSYIELYAGRTPSSACPERSCTRSLCINRKWSFTCNPDKITVLPSSLYEVCTLSNETGNVAPDLATLQRRDLEGRGPCSKQSAGDNKNIKYLQFDRNDKSVTVKYWIKLINL
ncbi:hypothetical protein NQ318_014413 [Aromia moschata]|uniref:Uncharacterized protein n=1 Tax=Aromia moschata TaxID=1265417 RepID=A0AAV8Y6V4_9CUCU|nr:hypothetical protein NQ318_014413 [Aromia moschata]